MGYKTFFDYSAKCVTYLDKSKKEAIDSIQRGWIPP